MSENHLLLCVAISPSDMKENVGKMPLSRFDENVIQSCLVAMTS